ncbi:uncharacterized protein LOC126281772 isoform X1 [Schistocerca gregaria]|uniref:uncharacterized protein LOC126281772 isoform X1 n=1 Tax=Schistocerca gregaria TaxID=7010 RepID=UPI00211E8B75|nr:uncharacterized protein LOC126281772 isoform X1 [Schistocerca gregaria]XP_049836927.1 uncharacterized protein LOC126281772 isoform X1 [Schistocerca gregaria]XP_049836929.1 uncharacterized protein LOC126281772 isoform X1 [Schistocerca gregaria]
MGVQVTFLFLVVSVVRAQAKVGNGEAASAWASKLDTEIPAYCNVPPKQDWNIVSYSDKHGDMVPSLDSSAISLDKLFHVSSYQIPEVIENFSIFKTISGCTCAVKDETALCNELHMNQIPSCVGNKSAAVILISRKVSGITAETFKYTPNLEYLNLTKVGLRQQLSADMFSQLYKLKHLAIQDHGSMPELPEDVFKGLGGLESLYLYNNGLLLLPPNIFAPLTKLRLLNLADNKFRRLPTGIFDKNLELRELILNGNHLKNRYNPHLLSHNAELRVLLMKDTHSSELNVNLLESTTKLRWLDLSDNYLKQLPAAALQNCQKLNRLGITGNRLENLDVELLLQHNIGLQRLDLRGNEWNCNCSIIPLSGWTLVREEAVAGRPVCQQPPEVVGTPLQEWFCTHGNVCTTSGLQKDLSEFVELTEAIADNHTFLEPRNISHIISNCFFFGMSSELGSSIDLVVGRFTHLLGDIHQRKHGTATNKRGPVPQIDTAALARQEPTLRFSYIFQNIPENLKEAVNAGLEAEIISMLHSSNSQETAPSNATSSVRIVIGLREEFRRIFSVYQNCSFPFVSRTEMEAAFPQSSSAIGFVDVSLYIYLAVLVMWAQ